MHLFVFLRIFLLSPQVGHIKTKNNEYYIEPSKLHAAAHNVNGHPHVVFQRSSVKEKVITEICICMEDSKKDNERQLFRWVERNYE